MPKPVVIDTDCGVDDALALILAMRSPELKVEGITTVAGNVEVEACTRNVQRVLAVLKLTEPPLVAQGEARPLFYPLRTAPEVHGEDGLGGVSEIRASPQPLPSTAHSAVDVLIRLVSKHPNRLTVITLGPLTNVARAFLKAPNTMQQLKEIVMMGGCFGRWGNTTPLAEFNFHADPHAAQVVLRAGVPVTIVPLNVTERVILRREELERAHKEKEKPSRLKEFVCDITEFTMRYHEHWLGFYGLYLHDPLTVAVFIEPTLVKTVEAHVEVETQSSLTRGVSVGDWHFPTFARTLKNARVCVEVDVERFQTLVRDRLLLSSS